MTLEKLIKQECRFHEGINKYGELCDDIAVFMSNDTMQRYRREITPTKDGLFIGPFRVLIDYRVAAGTVQLSFV